MINKSDKWIIVSKSNHPISQNYTWFVKHLAYDKDSFDFDWFHQLYAKNLMVEFLCRIFHISLSFLSAKI